MTLRETIARAIGQASGCVDGYEANDLRIADAVLDAMIEAGPTEAMLDAPTLVADDDMSLRAAWVAMLTAAKAERPA